MTRLAESMNNELSGDARQTAPTHRDTDSASTYEKPILRNHGHLSQLIRGGGSGPSDGRSGETPGG